MQCAEDPPVDDVRVAANDIATAIWKRVEAEEDLKAMRKAHEDVRGTDRHTDFAEKYRASRTANAERVHDEACKEIDAVVHRISCVEDGDLIKRVHVFVCTTFKANVDGGYPPLSEDPDIAAFQEAVAGYRFEDELVRVVEGAVGRL